MSALPPIPIPLAQRWREFRFRAFPTLMFLGALGAVVILWRDFVGAPTLVGQVAAPSAQVISPDAGVLTNVTVTLFSRVQAGQILAEVDSTVTYRLDLAREQMRLAQAEIDPVLRQQQNALDYQRLRLELRVQEVDLATARINLSRAQSELERKTPLHQQQLITEDEFELASKTKEALETEVQQRTRLTEELRGTLQEMAFLTEASAPQATNDPLRPMREWRSNHPELAQSRLQPIPLRAPIDGIVTAIYRVAGETLTAGEPVLTISVPHSERIDGFLRQPIPPEVQVGASITVQARSPRRETAVAAITHLGSRLEFITNLALLRPGFAVEMGLPFTVSLPPELELRPGELVDLTLLTRRP